MHPETAARLVRAFVPAGGYVLDPFCGSGTVLVEALILGRKPFGVDLNPLAVRLAACKTRPRTRAQLDNLMQQAQICSAFAETRKKAKAGATRRFSREDVTLFEPHVLLELDSLRAKLETMGDDPVRLDLSLVLSSLLVKLSRKRGDTSTRTVARHTSAGFASRLFVQKTDELAHRLAAFRALMPTPLPQPAVVAEDDATELKTLLPGKVDAIVTSPPYAATYDYVAHHALRLRWLGLDSAAFSRGELGARSTFSKLSPRHAVEAWSRELSRFFRSAAKVLSVGSPLVLVMADSAVGSVALRADEIVASAARDCGFEPVARASQARPHFHAPSRKAFSTSSRAEHAILLRRSPGESAAQR
jgi:DNA modification methylase